MLLLLCNATPIFIIRGVRVALYIDYAINDIKQSHETISQIFKKSSKALSWTTQQQNEQTIVTFKIMLYMETIKMYKWGK